MLKNNISTTALEVCNSGYIDIKIAKSLKMLIDFNHDDAETITNYLSSNLPSVVPYFLELLEEKTHKIKAPPGRSALNWTFRELMYYGIEITEELSWYPKIAKRSELTTKAKKFLEETNFFNEFVMKSTQFKELGQKKWNIFLNKCYFSYLRDNEEPKIDDILETFCEQIMDLEYFGITPQENFPLKVNNYKGEARVDICVYYYALELPGVIIGEDKIVPGNSLNEGEAQVIAQAIAVSQQNDWPNLRPVYFFKVRGFELFFYKAIFDKSFCEKIVKGAKAIVTNEVWKYPKRFGGKGLNLLHPWDRKDLAEILCSIEKEIIEFK